MERQVLNILEQFVLFYEAQEKEGLVDGAYDPTMAVEGAKIILNAERPDWRVQEAALPA
jgi:hypothetical protein